MLFPTAETSKPFWLVWRGWGLKNISGLVSQTQKNEGVSGGPMEKLLISHTGTQQCQVSSAWAQPLWQECSCGSHGFVLSLPWLEIRAGTMFCACSCRWPAPSDLCLTPVQPALSQLSYRCWCKSASCQGVQRQVLIGWTEGNTVQELTKSMVSFFHHF